AHQPTVREEATDEGESSIGAPQRPGDREIERRAVYPAVAHNGGHELERRHVEGRIVDRRLSGSGHLAVPLTDLVRVALLDLDRLAGRSVRIERGRRGGDVERNVVM